MGTTADKLQAIVDSTNDIQAAINEKGVEVDNLVPLRLYGDKIREISGGGADHSLPVLFFDYDGTLLHSYTIAEAQALTSLPELPTHDLLTGDGWTHTLEQVNGVVGALHVGAQYRITDGKTHAWVTLTPVSGLALPICFTVTGTATIRVDWGDGQTQNATATSTLTHNYATYGDYEITLERISGTGTYGLGRGDFATQFVGGASDPYRQSLTKIYIGDNATLVNYALYSCTSLYSLVIPDNTALSAAPLGYVGACYALKASIIPNGTTSINQVYNNCQSLTVSVIPNSVTSIAASSFAGCNVLTSLIIPENVTTIGNNAFSASRRAEFIFKREIPPTFGTTVFNGITSIRKIYVPDESVNAYKTATNWAAYADYIYPISSRP